MRWFLRSLVAIAILWAFFAASPYLALYDLAQAVERGDTHLLAQRVNFRALRFSLAKDLIDAYLIETDADADGRITPSERQLATSAVATFGEPLLEKVVTPQGLIDLMRARVDDARPRNEAPQGLGGRSAADLFHVIARAQTRGFRNIAFIVPPRAETESRFRIHFRLTRFEWRVVRLELPAEIRRRLSRQIASQTPADLDP